MLRRSLTVVYSPLNTQERQTRAFGTHARALAEWDRHIYRNRRTLASLEADIARVAGQQEALERQLNILEVHQAEIHDALEGMQREAQALYDREGVRDDDASRQRDALFALAEDVAKQLTDIGLALKDTVQIVNNQAAADPGADPLAAAVQILNNQLASLVWIEGQAKQLGRRVDAIAEPM
jgi:septal ring factor EnvC (AmiA/AmiB activator)